jgi:hypothetical protein
MEGRFTVNKQKYDIIVVTPFYKRSEILDIFLKHLKKLQKEVNLHAILIGSRTLPNEASYIMKHGFEYVYAPNTPLSNKWNEGIKRLQNYDFKACMILGSDDIISTNLVKRFLKVIELGIEFTGVLDAYVYNIDKKEGVYWSGYTNAREGESVGIGRTYSKKLISKLGYRLWSNDMNRCLDGNVQQRIKGCTKVITRMFDDEYLIDIKCDDCQITSYDRLAASNNSKQIENGFFEEIIKSCK